MAFALKAWIRTTASTLAVCAAYLSVFTPPVHADVFVVQSGNVVAYDQGSALVVFGPRTVPQAEPTASVSTSGTVVRARLPRSEILAAIEAAAGRYARDPAIARAGLTASDWIALVRSNVQIESGFNPAAQSHVGAIGLGQLMPETARQLGVDPYDMHENLDGSARYLLAMLTRFGSGELALAAYNAGPEAVARYGGIPPFAETQGHVRKVMSVFAQVAAN
jgi:hypothetical protein